MDHEPGTGGRLVRILHVVPSYLPARRYGGPIVSVHALCTALQRSGAEVDVFTTDADGPTRSQVPLEQRVDLDGVGVHYFARRSPRRLYRAPGLARALEQRIAGYDIVHLHSIFLWPTLVAARAARRQGVPWIVSPRGMLVEDLFQKRGTLRKRLWLELFERDTLMGAAGLHATSSLEIAEAQAFGLHDRPWFVVPNGFEPPLLDTTAALTPAVRDVIAEGFEVLFLGRISWKKGLDHLLEALARIPRVRLVIAGPDDEGLTPQLVRLARELGIANRIRFVGPVDGAAKSALFTTVRCLALPSSNENFANVVLEALAAGLPVATTPGVGTAPLVLEHGVGRVASNDPSEFARALRELIELPHQERQRIAQRGPRLVDEHFAWDAIATSMLARYAECLPQSNPNLSRKIA